MKDFFVSYNQNDRDWAEWIAWQLESAGWTAVIQAWDFRPGGNFALDMHRAALDTRTTIAVLSEGYLASGFTQPEWAAAFARDPTSASRTLLPVRVRECKPAGLLAQVVWVDLLGLDQAEARERLLAAVKDGRSKPADSPAYPGTTRPAPAFPHLSQRPHYRDDFTRDLGERLDQLLDTEIALRSTGAGQEEIHAVVSKVLELKRQLREGPQLQAGDWLSNRYRLLKELGSGGFATVWLAFDKKRRHSVAVKVLHGQHSDSAERLARFRRGARIMDQLAHPNIVRIQDRDQEDGGYHYFVMEHITGGTFMQAVTSGVLSVEKRIEIVLQIADALSFAHERDILHRDVTPDNILLDAAGSPAKLTDFDLVRVADSTGGTRTGALGKFIYAAPESMESANDVDARCDVYSLGMTAVFSFHGKKLPASALMYNRARFIEGLDCPRRVKSVLAQATEPDRDQRFPTMEEFCTALRKTCAKPSVRPALGADSPKLLVNSIGMKFMLIPAGKFTMGSPKDEEGRSDDEGPQHEVEITRPFYLGVYQVTQAQWRTVMGSNPSYFCATGKGKHKVAGMDTSEFPVESVSWEEVEEFCKKLTELIDESGRTYRLPTEAEWEYSCRGGASSYQVFHFGDSLSSEQANFNGNNPYGGADKGEYLERTCKVGSYPANGFGLHDMHGNVWEWCADWYDENYYATSPRQDPTGPAEASARVLRGGSWNNDGWYCRSAYRFRNVPVKRNLHFGFRLAAVPSLEQSKTASGAQAT